MGTCAGSRHLESSILRLRRRRGSHIPCHVRNSGRIRVTTRCSPEDYFLWCRHFYSNSSFLCKGLSLAIGNDRHLDYSLLIVTAQRFAMCSPKAFMNRDTFNRVMWSFIDHLDRNWEALFSCPHCGALENCRYVRISRASS